MARQMQIRDARIQDAPAISQLLTDAVREHISPTISAAGTERLLSEMDTASVESYLRNHFRFFLAEVDGTLAGLSAAILPSHLFYLFVRTDFQRQGIGRSLWTHARDWFIESFNSETITVNSSLNAVAAYERFGFKTEGGVVEKNHVRFQPMRWTRPAERPGASPS